MAKRVFKSKKKLSKGRCVYRKWSEWEVGDVLIGKLQGVQIDNYDKPNYLIEVEDAQFSSAKDAKKLIGKTLGLNSCGKVDAALVDKDNELKVDIGTILQFTYNGTSEIEKGKFKGKEAHDVEVEEVEEDDGEEIDDEDLDEDDSDDDDNDADEDEDEDEDDEENDL